MKILNMGTKYTIYDSSIDTYDLLPSKTYVVCYDQREGCFLVERENIEVTEKTYGEHLKKLDKVMSSFKEFDRSLGVILSGDKGIGKSVFAKLVCQEAVKTGLPVILVEACVPGIGSFIESIKQECVVLFDEFDKTFRSRRDDDDQAKLLSLFDGTSGGKKLYIVTCNELYGLNDYIVNRPGRFHYHFRFEYPTNEDIKDYLTDKLKPEHYGEIHNVIAFSQKISLNYDCLRSIAFELNNGTSFSEAVRDLNILNVNEEEYNVRIHFEGGKTLHHFRFRTNLFNNDGYYTWITMYDDGGRAVMDVKYDKNYIEFDREHLKVVIPKAGFTLDFDDYDEDGISKEYMTLKPLYLSFEKRRARSLHYAV